ncbi:hypothetical protein RhiJN_01682 [Ceratobasidium sp. AG-Ba]|nr:hypothetical protein RhiJN_01682 [Ceratobasidium sp. AG-Ba]QRW02608.1 hypothetical protein RhiLY_01607 [Ceratobasidium sp. AG-Ba]
MSRNYLPKAAAGLFFLTGAALLLDSGESLAFKPPSFQTAGSQDPAFEHASMTHRTSQLANRWRAQVSKPQRDKELDEDMDVEDDFLLDELTRRMFDLVAMMSRHRLRHPDEQVRILYWEVEGRILQQWASVEDDAVDLGAIFLLVSLANECLEVARESYTISMARHETNWFEKSLTWGNRRFRRIYRMSADTVNSVVDKLSRNPIFVSTGPRPQRPVIYQFATFLLRYGNGYSNAYNPHLKTSIGEGSVFNYCRRICRALREIGLHAAAWPDRNHKREIKQTIFQKTRLFDNCIGIADLQA